jgi:hypothetical protein
VSTQDRDHQQSNIRETNDQSTSVSEKVDLDRERFSFDREIALRSAIIEEKRFKAENRNRWWTSLSIVIPIFTLLLAWHLTAISDRTKAQRDERVVALKEQRTFIQRQLSDLYFPLLLSSQMDDAFWCLSMPDAEGCKGETKERLNRKEKAAWDSKQIVAIHEQTLEMLKKNFNLLRNPYEGNIGEFLESVNHYQQNATLYDLLRANEDDRVPAQFGFDYALKFTPQIKVRIDLLEVQEKWLTDQIEHQ